MLSNASLFLALPFAYLFCESEGLPFFGNKRGLMARAKETILTLILLSFVIMGLMYILAALIDWDRDSFDRLISKLPKNFKVPASNDIVYNKYIKV